MGKELTANDKLPLWQFNIELFGGSVITLYSTGSTAKDAQSRLNRAFAAIKWLPGPDQPVGEAFATRLPLVEQIADQSAPKAPKAPKKVA